MAKIQAFKLQVFHTANSLNPTSCPPVLGTREAAHQTLCSVLGPSLQERHGGAGVFPEKGNKAGEGSREQVL